MSDTMSWSWIAAALILPFAPAAGVAWPFWGRSRDSLGSVLGTFVIFVFALAFVAREYVHVQQVIQGCIAAEAVCRFHPEPFTRFCVYGFIALAQAFLLFMAGAAIEGRIENRAFAEQWRR